MHETLTYDFDDVKPDSAIVTLRWEKLAVPFRVKADQEATLTNIQHQLRNLAQYNWAGWNDAADWCLNNKTNLETALKWAGTSITLEDRFENEMTRSALLKELKRDSEAVAAAKRAVELGNAAQLYGWARQLQAQGQKTEALDYFRAVAKRFPDHWLAHLSQARLSVAAGDFTTALKEVQAAQTGAPPANQQGLRNLQKRIENKEDING
jgi:tetratricopeptide (TPR) repeat protein